jgi:hypothetical protein
LKERKYNYCKYFERKKLHFLTKEFDEKFGILNSSERNESARWQNGHSSFIRKQNVPK